MHCPYFDAGACRSCTLMGAPYAEQLTGKDRACRELLADHTDLRWLPPVAGPDVGYRNKAKMVVAGTVEAPTLGILDADGHGVDLRACGICSPGLRAALPVLAAFVTRARLTPYDVPTRTGELKHVLVTESPDSELMVRLVVRSREPLARVRKHLPALLAALPQARVVTLNLQPAHAAVLEGEEEIVLTPATTLRMRLPGATLHLPPQSFFQTSTVVGAALYREAARWVAGLAPTSVWDLYCGVGGFALHLAAPGRTVTGVESSTEAVRGARTSARQAGLDDVRFEVGDATAFALAAAAPPDLAVLNPPRRGTGPELARWLETSGVPHVLYSSCNADSLRRDLAAMPSLRPRLGRVLDMFPQTAHYEVLVLLERA